MEAVVLHRVGFLKYFCPPPPPPPPEHVVHDKINYFACDGLDHDLKAGGSLRAGHG